MEVGRTRLEYSKISELEQLIHKTETMIKKGEPFSLLDIVGKSPEKTKISISGKIVPKISIPNEYVLNALYTALESLFRGNEENNPLKLSIEKWNHPVLNEAISDWYEKTSHFRETHREDFLKSEIGKRTNLFYNIKLIALLNLLAENEDKSLSDRINNAILSNPWELFSRKKRGERERREEFFSYMANDWLSQEDIEFFSTIKEELNSFFLDASQRKPNHPTHRFSGGYSIWPQINGNLSQNSRLLWKDYKDGDRLNEFMKSQVYSKSGQVKRDYELVSNLLSESFFYDGKDKGCFLKSLKTNGSSVITASEYELLRSTLYSFIHDQMRYSFESNNYEKCNPTSLFRRWKGKDDGKWKDKDVEIDEKSGTLNYYFQGAQYTVRKNTKRTEAPSLTYLPHVLNVLGRMYSYYVSP